MTPSEQHRTGAIGLLISQRADRDLLAGFFVEMGHPVVAPEPGKGIGNLEGAALIIVDEPAAHRHREWLLQHKERVKPVTLPVLVAVPPRSDGTRWLTLGFDELLRMPIVKHEMLARIGTFLRLRQHSEEALKTSEAFSRATLDAIPASVCVVDAAGTIDLANRTWHEFAAANSAIKPAACEGANYLAVCEAAMTHAGDESRGPLAMMIDVLQGRRHSCVFEYPCHAPGERRWFLASAVRFATAGKPFTVVTHTNITARRESELATARSEERFRQLVALSSDFYWETDPEHRLTRNAAPKADVIIGKRRWELPCLAPEAPIWAAHRQALDERQPFRDFEFSRPTADGKVLQFSISGEPMHDEEGRFLGYRGVGSDITERKRQARLVAMEHAVSRCLADIPDEKEALRELHRIVCESEGWDCGRFWRFEEERNVLRGDVYWAIDDQSVIEYVSHSDGVILSPGQGVAGTALRSREPVWSEDLLSDSRAWNPVHIRRAGMRGACAVPVIHEGRMLGVMRFTGRVIREPDQQLLATLQSIGEQAAQFLARAQSQAMLEESHRRLTLHAARQSRIAELGQEAFSAPDLDSLLEKAVRSGIDGVIEAAAILEEVPGAPYKVRASAALDELSSASAITHARSSGQARPDGSPDCVLVPIHGLARPFGNLAIFAKSPHVLGFEERQFAQSLAHVVSSSVRRSQRDKQLMHMAQYDALTDLPNRSLLEDRLRHTIAQARRKHWHAAFLFVDLDRFKMVNDTFGHAIGDELLCEVARRLQGCVRADDTVGRISGDEFGVVLADLASGEDAGIVADKIKATLQQPFAVEGGKNELFISVSIGISTYPSDTSDAETLIRNADMAMYRVKETGRNAYQHFTPAMNERTVSRLKLGTELRRAVERREFELHYQPKVDLETKCIVGAEALIRWRHPERGLVPPAEFIPALEESGLILAVGDWVVEEACARIRRWQMAGLQAVPVAVNVSAKQFRQPDIERMVRDALRSNELAPHLLEIEVTESSLAEDPAEAVRILSGFREAGMKISVDDFGTGYSSLSSLTQLPLSALKIDRSFVSRAVERSDAASIVRAIIDMAHTMGFLVIAEGVETEQQASFLWQHKCDQAQGYLYGRPETGEQLALRLPRLAAKRPCAASNAPPAPPPHRSASRQ